MTEKTTQFIICHYDEIGLKGRNRKFFEEKLVENIRQTLRNISPESLLPVRRISGRIIIEIPNIKSLVFDKIRGALSDVFGISYFAFAVNTGQNLAEIKKGCLEIAQNKKFKTFRISAQRSFKDFPLTSQEINEEVGAYIVEKLERKVKLKDPDINIFIEIVEKFAFIYLEKIGGPGGLPVGISGKVISMLSAGIDSPVASHYLFKRGARIVFLHFHSLPFTTQASIEKVKKLVSILNKFQFSSKLYLVPFAEIQKEIQFKTPPKLRIILYRRIMFKIAEQLARKVGAKAIITGESLGQVASQTLENILAVEEGVKIPVLRPLIGFDKKEIIAKARQIGTYDISIEPHEDCCSLFLPKNPETKAKLLEVLEAEKLLNEEFLISQAINNLEIVKT